MARPRKRAAASPARALRRLDEPFHEWRYLPRSSRSEVAGVGLISFGGLAVGMGVYALFIRDPDLEPIPYAAYLLALGIVLVVAYFLFGSETDKPVRVGELGVGFEDDGRVSRTRWYELEKVRLTDGALRLSSAGKPLTLPLRVYAPAVQRIVSEAQKRIPKRLELDDDDLARIGRPNGAQGERVVAEPPQVTQLHCSASDRPLTFEKDARLCARCGALYHRAAIPRRCVECGKKLRAS